MSEGVWTVPLWSICHEILPQLSNSLRLAIIFLFLSCHQFEALLRALYEIERSSERLKGLLRVALRGLCEIERPSAMRQTVLAVLLRRRSLRRALLLAELRHGQMDLYRSKERLPTAWLQQSGASRLWIWTSTLASPSQ